MLYTVTNIILIRIFILSLTHSSKDHIFKLCNILIVFKFTVILILHI